MNNDINLLLEDIPIAKAADPRFINLGADLSFLSKMHDGSNEASEAMDTSASGKCDADAQGAAVDSDSVMHKRPRLSSFMQNIPGYIRDAYEERAAIIQFEGKVTREEAEREAEILIESMYSEELRQLGYF